MKILFIDSAHPSLKKELEKNNFTCDDDVVSPKEEIEKKVSLYNGIILRSRINIDKHFIDCFSPAPSRLRASPPRSRLRQSEEALWRSEVERVVVRQKFIARVGAGVEHIDVAYAESKGIKCLSSPEGNRNAVAEHALGMLLSLMNKICKANSEVKTRQWLREANRGTELEGKTIGIYGYGNTGSAFAKVLRGFDVRILAYDKYKKGIGEISAIAGVREATPEEIFSEADVLSLHLPLSHETKYMVNDSFINKFRKNIYLINTSRGPIIKTGDLVKNIKTGKILGACLDVIEYEETSFEEISSAVSRQSSVDLDFLMSSNKVILTPHIAGWSFESSEKMAGILAKKIIEIIPKQNREYQ